MSEKKPKSNAILLGLPPNQQEQLASWLMDENISYRKAVERVRLDFGVKCSTNGMGEFWRQVCAPRKLRRSSSAANAVAELAQSLDTDWDKANAQLLAQKVFEMMSDPATDPQAVSFLAGALEKYKARCLKEKELDAKIAGSQQKYEQREREIAQRERQLVLEREKFETDAVAKAMKHVAQIKTITHDRSLNAGAQAAKVRHLLFPQIAEADQT